MLPHVILCELWGRASATAAGKQHKLIETLAAAAGCDVGDFIICNWIEVSRLLVRNQPTRPGFDAGGDCEKAFTFLLFRLCVPD
jgi:hypothetical protein